MQCFLVGGAVRDQLLNYPCSERDWVVVGATPEQMIAAGFRPVGRDFPVFLHPETQEEYALARTERKSGRGHQGFTFNASPSVTLEEDLARRDLTINAMAQTADGSLVDPYGGQRDLAERVLRHVSAAFVEDPLRVLRVARFASRYAHLGFRIAPETQELMHRIVAEGELNHLSAERVWREVERALGQRSPQVFFAVLADCGALTVWMPELQAVTATTWNLLRNLADQAAQHPTATPVPTIPIRFALLAADLPGDAVENLCVRLKVPNAVRDLARLAALIVPQTSTPPTAEQVLHMLDLADSWRRPERLQQLVTVLALHQPDSKWSTILTDAYTHCTGVDHRQWLAQGLKGKDIGAALKRERLTIIEGLLNEA